MYVLNNTLVRAIHTQQSYNELVKIVDESHASLSYQTLTSKCIHKNEEDDDDDDENV